MALIWGCLMAKFLDRDQSQLFLLPVDMREWVPEDDLAHFVVELVDRVPMSAFVPWSADTLQTRTSRISARFT